MDHPIQIVIYGNSQKLVSDAFVEVLDFLKKNLAPSIELHASRSSGFISCKYFAIRFYGGNPSKLIGLKPDLFYTDTEAAIFYMNTTTSTRIYDLKNCLIGIVKNCNTAVEYETEIPTNKECAKILNDIATNLRIYEGRGNGKSLLNFRRTAAFMKAIKLLEETPD